MEQRLQSFLQKKIRREDFILDFTQDAITANGNSAQLNPVMNSVLAGFNRRRRFNRFKYGNRTLDFDRIHFADTASKLDGDQFATDVGGKKTKKVGSNFNSGSICRFYQRTAGCYRSKCTYLHQCIICMKAGHGAVKCSFRHRDSTETTRDSQRASSRERPPDPRTRRARAN